MTTKDQSTVMVHTGLFVSLSHCSAVFFFLCIDMLICCVFFFSADSKPRGFNSSAMEGNFLDAINLGLDGKMHRSHPKYVAIHPILLC